MKIYLRCFIETDEFTIEDFKNGGILDISPNIDSNELITVATKKVPFKSADKLLNSVLLKEEGMLK